MSRRSAPLKIAPLIPLLGLVGLFGIEKLHSTPFLPAFVITWFLLLAALFTYVFSKMMQARRTRSGR
jgi:hypothetical protein